MTYKVGTIEDFKRWTMTVAREPARVGEQPKKWYDSEETASRAQKRVSAESLVKLLSDENLHLLKVIAGGEFQSVSALAQAVHRAEPNLSRTLKKLAEAGIVALESHGRAVKPRLVAQRVTLDLDLVGATSAVSLG